MSLTRAGYSVSVICPRGNGRDEAAYDLREGVAIHRYALSAAEGGKVGYGREYATAFWQTWRMMRTLSRSAPFDVIHACNPPDLLLLTAISQRRAGAAFVFDQHDLVPELFLSRFNPRRGVGYACARVAERVAFALADVVLSTNESYRQVALSRGHVDPSNVFVVRSAPDLSRFRPVPADPSLKRGKRHLLAYLGVMGPQDGVDHALYALAHLATRRDDWRAIFVGAGDVFGEMQLLSAKLGLAESVEFTGRIPDDELIQILCSADVGIAPDPKSPLNDVSTMNKIVEYMAAGLPVVSYDLAEARVSAGGAAVYCTPDEPAAMAGAIDELLASPGRRSAMAEEGARRVAAEFSWERSESSLLAAYERALERRGAVRRSLPAQAARG